MRAQDHISRQPIRQTIVGFTLWALLCVPLPFRGNLRASSEVDATLLSLQQMLEARVNEAIRHYDPKAMAFVRLDVARKPEALPFTPFVVERLELEPTGLPKFKNILVYVWTQNGELPRSIREIVVRACLGLGRTPVVTVAELPKEAISERSLGSLAISPAPLPPKPTFWEKHESDLSSFLRRCCQIAAGFGGLLLLGIVGQWIHSSRLLRTVKTIAETRPSSATPADAGDRSGSRPSDYPADYPAFGANRGSPFRPDLARKPKLWESGWLAILADCYWAGQDRYASFLWKRVPMSHRKKLLADLPFLAPYVEMVRNYPEEDLGHDQSPYYLEPLSIAQLDNGTITSLVLKHPALLLWLPALRLEHLIIPPVRRFELEAQAHKAKTIALPKDIFELPPSRLRELENPTPIAVASLEEEQEVLTFNSISLAIKERVPSLAWLLEVPPPDVEAKLRDFSADEIASAWIGPEKVLNSLSARIPREKLNRVLTRVGNRRPSRDSKTFRELHRFAIECLKARSPEPSPSAQNAG